MTEIEQTVQRTDETLFNSDALLLFLIEQSHKN